jgi:hypothetical protein
VSQGGGEAAEPVASEPPEPVAASGGPAEVLEAAESLPASP